MIRFKFQILALLAHCVHNRYVRYFFALPIFFLCSFLVNSDNNMHTYKKKKNARFFWLTVLFVVVQMHFRVLL